MVINISSASVSNVAIWSFSLITYGVLFRIFLCQSPYPIVLRCAVKIMARYNMITAPRYIKPKLHNVHDKIIRERITI